MRSEGLEPPTAGQTNAKVMLGVLLYNWDPPDLDGARRGTSEPPTPVTPPPFTTLESCRPGIGPTTTATDGSQEPRNLH